MSNFANKNDDALHYPIVGRDKRIDLEKYTTNVHGRDIIDYEKLRVDNPILYQEIVNNDAAADRKHDSELEKIFDTPTTPPEKPGLS